MKLRHRIKKWWLELPRFKIKFSTKKYYYDKRAFEWYLERELYGFDERELWALGIHFDDRVRKKYGFPQNESAFLTPEQYGVLFKKPEFTEDALWLYKRVKFYVEYECPFSYYDSKKSKFMDESERKIVLDKLLLILKHRSEGGNILEAEANLVRKYLGSFGW
jgi:hypothetical protein